jgi:D-alanyl-lipoteichoic acid acyltransferase DltB (MBOAT superfamily)
MKIVIADRLAIYVNAVYNNVENHSGKTLALATVFFAFQIYCDFAGYSNIAIGSAKIMGFKLMTNFNRPYFSKSISEFWKRWHISLSTWFKDYLYISLGGNRVSIPRWYMNLFIVFIISGLWHGANWTYIIWGGINGLYLVIEIIFEKRYKNINNLFYLHRIPIIKNVIRIIMTFILVCVAWVFFRANNTNDAFIIIKEIFCFEGALFIDKTTISYSLFGMLLLVLIEVYQEYISNNSMPFKKSHWIVEQLFYSCLIILIIIIGVFDGGQFIYFQF